MDFLRFLVVPFSRVLPVFLLLRLFLRGLSEEEEEERPSESEGKERERSVPEEVRSVDSESLLDEERSDGSLDSEASAPSAPSEGEGESPL